MITFTIQTSGEGKSLDKAKLMAINYRMKQPTIKPKNAKQSWHLPSVGQRNWNGARVLIGNSIHAKDSRGTNYARLGNGQIIRGKKGGGNERS